MSNHESKVVPTENRFEVSKESCAGQLHGAQLVITDDMEQIWNGLLNDHMYSKSEHDADFYSEVPFTESIEDCKPEVLGMIRLCHQDVKCDLSADATSSSASTISAFSEGEEHYVENDFLTSIKLENCFSLNEMMTDWKVGYRD